MADDTYITAWRIPANNKLPGESGYRGASSLLPGENAPKSEYAPHNDAAGDILRAGGMSFAAQTRKIDTDRLAAPIAHGMAPRKSDGTIPPNGRPVTKKAADANRPGAPCKKPLENKEMSERSCYLRSVREPPIAMN